MTWLERHARNIQATAKGPACSACVDHLIYGAEQMLAAEPATICPTAPTCPVLEG